MLARTNEMETHSIPQIILKLTSILLINLTTFLLFVQRVLSNIPLGFFLIHVPSSIMAFHFRLFGIFI